MSNFSIGRLERDDGTSLAVYSWSAPARPIKAAVQIVHGLAEHAARYDRLAQALTEAGYVVYASDHRGHGQTPRAAIDYGHFADRDGFDLVVEDVHAVNRYIAQQQPGVGIVMFAHSFGSFVAQRYLGLHGDTLLGAVLSGTSSGAAALLRVAVGVARIERLRVGPRNKSAVLQKLIFGGYNNAFKPTRTDFDWLSRDVDEVDKYVDDPLCGFDMTTQAWYDLLQGMLRNEDDALRAGIPKNLPIYIMSGSVDPTGRASQGPKALVAAYQRAGLTRVTLRLYPGGRHEMVNEVNRDEVTADLIGWLDSQFASRETSGAA